MNNNIASDIRQLEAPNGETIGDQDYRNMAQIIFQ